MVPSPAPRLPAQVASADDRGQLRFVEFFAVTIRNLHTLRAYGRAISKFFNWCSQHDIPSLIAVQPLHVAATGHAAPALLAPTWAGLDPQIWAAAHAEPRLCLDQRAGAQGSPHVGDRRCVVYRVGLVKVPTCRLSPTQRGARPRCRRRLIGGDPKAIDSCFSPGHCRIVIGRLQQNPARGLVVDCQGNLAAIGSVPRPFGRCHGARSSILPQCSTVNER